MMGIEFGRNEASLEALTVHAVTLIRSLPTLEHVRLKPMGPAERGTPSVLRTAPAWLPILGTLLLMPTHRRRRYSA